MLIDGKLANLIMKITAIVIAVCYVLPVYKYDGWSGTETVSAMTLTFGKDGSPGYMSYVSYLVLPIIVLVVLLMNETGKLTAILTLVNMVVYLFIIFKDKGVVGKSVDFGFGSIIDIIGAIVLLVFGVLQLIGMIDLDGNMGGMAPRRNMNFQQNPYGQQRMPQQNPYGQQGMPQQNPYAQQRMPQQGMAQPGMGQAQTQARPCPRCGAMVPAASRFCTKCGTQV